MQKITILYIMDTFTNLAGAEKNLYEVVTRLDKEKYRPIVYILSSGTLIDVLRQKNIPVRDLGIKKIYGFKALCEGIKLIKFIKKEKIQIVVTYHDGSDFWGGIFAKLAGVPVIISSRRDMGYKLKKRHIFFYKIINNLLFDKLITVSDAVKNVLVKQQNVIPKKVCTIYNGVKNDRFSKKQDIAGIKKKIGLKTTAPVVGIIAGVRPIKGHRYFLEAASIVLKKIPEAQFLIVGYILENDSSQELSNKLGIADNVIFTGERADIPEMLSIMDISVLSSLSEGFSNTILESMAAGKPVIATNVGGNSEVVVDNETGLLVSPANSQMLAEAMLHLLKNKELAQKMGEAGRKKVETIFNFQVMLTKLEKLYNWTVTEKTVKKESSTFVRMLLVRLFKTLFSAVLYYSGMIYLYRKISSKLVRRNDIKILAYHKISDDLPNYLGLNTTIAGFEKQIRYLKQHYNIISLSDAVDLIQSGEELSEDVVVITFDDGYKDNYTNAFPIIKKYNIPVTIFLAAGLIGSKRNPWFGNITEMLMGTSKDSIDLETFGLAKYPIATVKQKEKAITIIIKYAKKLGKEERQSLIKCISEKLEIDYSESDQMLSWDEIIEMKKNGVSFGTHTMTHTILTNIPLKESEYEIVESKRIIEERLKAKVSFLSYPNGSSADFNKEIIKILKDNGFSCACTLVSGANNTDLFALKRRCMTVGVSKGVFGYFSKSLFAVEMAGIFNFLRKQWNKV